MAIHDQLDAFGVISTAEMLANSNEDFVSPYGRIQGRQDFSRKRPGVMVDSRESSSAERLVCKGLPKSARDGKGGPS